MSSSRFPGKVLENIARKPMLHHVINQAQKSKLITRIIVATTTRSVDNPIVDFCKKNKIKYFRGSETDVLDRYYKCAKKFKCTSIVRICSDCPLIDPQIIDRVIRKFKNNSFDYVGSTIDKIGKKWEYSACNFPQGMAVEISTFKSLERSWKEAKKPSEREHVFPYIQSNPDKFKIANIKNKVDYSYIRCTVDKKEDLDFVREIYRRIPKNESFVTIKGIVNIVNKNTGLLKINNNITINEGYKKSLEKDRIQGFN